MNRLVSRAIVASAVLCVSIIAAAESTFEEVWTCELEDDKTIEDVQAANSKWLKWLNENVEGGNIHSSVATSVVGSAEHFLFVDSYPDLATWSAAKAALDTEEGQALEEMFDGIFDCSKNRLFKLTQTE